MSERVTMPALGESVTEGTVTRWLKNVGDTVEVDEPLLEVSTDKVDTEIPSPVAGTLQEILVQEDETAPVGADLAVIGDGAPPTASTAQEAPAQEKAEEPEQAPAPQTTTASDTGQVTGGEKVVMPALGESVTEGTVTRWLKNVGDTVEVDEPLLEVSTDKVDTEIPSPVAGTLQEILVQEDETAPVGADLAVIGGEATGAAEQGSPEPPTEEKAEAAPAAPPAPREEDAAPQQEQAKVTESDQTAYVTPLVRKLAAEHGVELASLKGTGVGGRIRKQDVLEAASAKQQAAAPAAPVVPASPPAAATAASAPVVSSKRGTTEKMSRLRKIIAQRMVESLQTSAQLTAVVEVDMSQVAALRTRAKAEFEKREGAKLSFLPFISLATVETLKQFPHLNASIDGDEIVFHGAEHLGIAVDTDRGLLVPVIKDAGDLNIAGLARKIADLAERTRTNKVGPDELGGGTFTISNIGSNGSLQDTPIINQPQVAILGTGTITKRPVVIKDALGGESIAIRSMMYLCLTYDHRVVDGADAGRFLSALKTRLEGGAFEL
ncbi:2-oxoglutarate dehydrogenase E2 component [Austwickia chelonae]|uniref:Dihydrolipoyllysine-residue succinyltransferase n=1 Tax=Austwickia chelonae NBRC 105200 TaxID=1184607 RepID=K6ULH7_9MICO|nr:2-oxoglutarate dehydrogenase, E2 component, dihydrolipoamide succinyltransferase [Austwickia chelonae]GAB77256.1 putative dihydrolipoamide acyltransferase [Austwickia chelonae NBRC 105200]SEW06294.1 2-oxoglutarate dehydrogenase E2 component [Austwickia chelonae]